ncbi:nucleotidyltransferase domain-containing protein [Candidatus Pacearchaeota archaeon]|nr:nucleotidyltransferase domain-containing protein [Candidatus Pacearchaeota archaeon]
MDELVEKIAREIKLLGNEISAITVYGSFAQGTPHKGSDIDYYVVLKSINLDILRDINALKKRLENAYGIELSINILKEQELPKTRKNFFYHKNRYALFLHEANKIDKVLIGESPFSYTPLPSLSEIRLEALRIVNSFAYTLRKALVNRGETETLFKDALRFCVYATQYAHACAGRYPLKTSESVRMFAEVFPDFEQRKVIDELSMIKRGEREAIDKSDLIRKALTFLESLDEYLFSTYGKYLQERDEIQN